MNRDKSLFPMLVSLLMAAMIFLAACSQQAPPPEKATTGTDSQSNLELLKAMPKIDAHAHLGIDMDDQLPRLIECLDEYNMRWVTIATGGMSPKERMDAKNTNAGHIHSLYPNHVEWAVTFGLTGWGKPGWLDEARASILDGFANGAIGVKVWKDIGMVLRDPDSSFVMIDDPRFDPIFDLIAAGNKTLYAHIGEPRNCWLPLDSMTVNNDRKYFEENPRYHAYLHPEIPHYWKQIAARDSVLARHPNLRMVGCHLGSLEWDVDVLAERFDRYPNFAVDMAARICHLQVQDREKVRAFLIKYQDRVLYGTDLSAGPRTPIDTSLALIRATYEKDFRYFATDEEMEVWEVDGKFRGLQLPAQVLRKIFHDNVIKWFPGGFGSGTN